MQHHFFFHDDYEQRKKHEYQAHNFRCPLVYACPASFLFGGGGNTWEISSWAIIELTSSNARGMQNDDGWTPLHACCHSKSTAGIGLKILEVGCCRSQHDEPGIPSEAPVDK